MENIPRIELIQVAETVAREKLIDKEDVILAMEEAIQKAARSKYGLERDIRANINRSNGAISIEQFTHVVEEVEDESTQMTLEEALRREVMEEVNVSVKNITYFGSQPWPFPSQLMLGYFCEYESGEIKIEEAELEDAKWFKIDNLPNVPPKLSISGQLISSYLEDRSKL